MLGPFIGRSETMHPLVGCTLLFAALASAGCRTMKPVTLDQLSVLGPDRVWVTESDESVVLIFEPKVVGDTLVGYVGRKHQKLPGGDLKQLRVRTSAPIRTTLLTVGLVAAFGGVLAAVSGTGQTQLQGPASGGSADCAKHPDQPGCPGY
jgi:hypothetical protein